MNKQHVFKLNIIAGGFYCCFVGVLFFFFHLFPLPFYLLSEYKCLLDLSWQNQTAKNLNLGMKSYVYLCFHRENT